MAKVKSKTRTRARSRRNPPLSPTRPVHLIPCLGRGFSIVVQARSISRSSLSFRFFGVYVCRDGFWTHPHALSQTYTRPQPSLCPVSRAALRPQSHPDPLSFPMSAVYAVFRRTAEGTGWKSQPELTQDTRRETTKQRNAPSTTESPLQRENGKERWSDLTDTQRDGARRGRTGGTSWR